MKDVVKKTIPIFLIIGVAFILFFEFSSGSRFIHYRASQLSGRLIQYGPCIVANASAYPYKIDDNLANQLADVCDRMQNIRAIELDNDKLDFDAAIIIGNNELSFFPTLFINNKSLYTCDNYEALYAEVCQDIKSWNPKF